MIVQTVVFMIVSCALLVLLVRAVIEHLKSYKRSRYLEELVQIIQGHFFTEVRPSGYGWILSNKGVTVEYGGPEATYQASLAITVKQTARTSTIFYGCAYMDDRIIFKDSEQEHALAPVADLFYANEILSEVEDAIALRQSQSDCESKALMTRK